MGEVIPLSLVLLMYTSAECAVFGISGIND
jgi:hypothetical protein